MSGEIISEVIAGGIDRQVPRPLDHLSENRSPLFRIMPWSSMA
jgi:hypothetical protein